MIDWLLGDWCFGGEGRSYARARANEARSAAVADAEDEREKRQALAALGGEQSFLLGTLNDGTPVKVSPREIGRHGMVWGSSGAGKSYGVHILTEGWTGADRCLQLIDPKGETYQLKALHMAAQYEALPEEEREAYAARCWVFDVTEDRVTPVDLFSVPEGMSPALLASLRTAATCDLSSHTFSDLMAYGVFLLYSTVINLEWPITTRVVRALFLDAAFRGWVAGLVSDARLRDSLEHLEETLPEQTRKAIVRQFDILLASAPARAGFGCSPAMVRELVPLSPAASIFLGNFGPTPQRPPALGKTMATNRLIDVLAAASVRTTPAPELLVLEEVGVLVKQTAVAEYLLEGSRTLRWKGLAIVCIAQDPANAIPREVWTALLLNSRWILSFECGREEALSILPHMRRRLTRSEAEERRGFVAEMARLPTQEAVFVYKGLAGFRLRLRDIENATGRFARDALLETFATKIASRSMVRLKEVEERIARFEATLFERRGTPRAESLLAPNAEATGSIEEFFSFLERARNGDRGAE